MSEFQIHVLHLLHADEHEPPENLREAADVIGVHGGVPDLSTLDNPPRVITVGPPMDHDIKVTLPQIATLDLPLLGIGTGSLSGLSAHVSAEISSVDLKAVLHLLSTTRDVWRLCGGEASASKSWLDELTDDITRMARHLLSLRMPNYLERVEHANETCRWIGSRLGMAEDDLRELLQASRLREVGKLGLPDSILFASRSSRSPEKQSIYDRYPVLGAHALSEMPLLKEVARILEYQLENFDGSGPAGLTAHQIPLSSRILRVAGAYEMIEMDADHPLSTDEVIAILERGQGSLYDPLLVRLVENYHRREDESSRGEVQNTERVRLADLVEGMVLAEDIWSRNGMKIVPHGTGINKSILQLLLSGPLDAGLESVEIFRGRKG